MSTKFTSRAASTVSSSHQTVSISTPIPPHGSLQNRGANNSAKYTDKQCNTDAECIEYKTSRPLSVLFYAVAAT